MSKPYRIVYAKLRAAGLTEAASRAMMGNWAKESLFDAFRREGDLSDAAIPSHEYVAAVTSGAISRERFATDGIGFGLAQWTYYNFNTGRGRKLNLWDFWQRSGQALDDPDMQTDFCIWELRNEYPRVLEELQKSDNLYYCVDLICKRYEQPSFNNVGDRYEAALEIARILETEEAEPEPAVEPEPAEDTPESPFWPPRMLCLGMIGADVTLLQALLLCRGYNSGGCSGVFGVGTEKALRSFQQAKGLKVDGVAGPESFKTLGLTPDIF